MIVKNKDNVTRGGRLDLGDYRLAEEDIRSPTVFHLTVFSEGIRSLVDIPDKKTLLRTLLEKVKTYAWSSKPGSQYEEGFLEMNLDEGKNILSCIYAKESALKVREEKDLKIVEETYKAITPSYKVEIELALNDDRTLSTIFYGGEEMFMLKARNIFFTRVRASLPHGFSLIIGYFDSKSMREILNQFGEDVEEIELGPGHSEKLRRFTEEHRELLYDVHLRAFGIRIRMAPAVRQLLEDQEIEIKEIKGYMKYGDTKVTTIIASSGRVHFHFSGGTFDEQSIYEAARKLYGKLRQQPIRVIEQKTIDSYFDDFGDSRR